jgi:acyl-CoA thioester hydrolase
MVRLVREEHMSPLLSDYPIVLTQDVIWGDMDAFAHVNNTVYFRYFEDARIAFFDALKVFEAKAQTQLGPILATTHCNFKLPLQFPDRIHIGARSVVLSPKKFAMYYAVYSEAFNAIAAEGEGLLVYYDYANGKSCAIPKEIVAAMRAMEPAAG